MAEPDTLAQGQQQIIEEARRRRTFAIISHPDAGKTTLTENFCFMEELFTKPAPFGSEKPTVMRPPTGWLLRRIVAFQLLHLYYALKRIASSLTCWTPPGTKIFLKIPCE